MTTPLHGKTALITGASRGIGKATALALAEKGANIAVNYLQNEGAAQKTAEEIRLKGVKAEIFQCNVGDLDALPALFENVTKTFGSIDILIHNAALGAFKPVHKLKMNQYDLSMNINTKAFLAMVQKVLPGMEAKKEGAILAISSLGSHRYIPNYGAIGISKAALESLIRYLAVELMPKGIRVNGVSGGLVDTDALKAFPFFEIFKQEVVKRTPAGRVATPEDLARVITFLCSPESSWIVGQIVIADGGLSLI
ncbi:MAG TPA: SDR family oxidoreductase [Candidatus Omnitrophota bacterium]|jgi:enoyl-[acyl-carrier protein] reductase III|nr:MAG: Enoyl-(acyl-carrier-protein) reductase (NADPH) FabL [Candidatus Omnitrophica bacterium ADurb.Bin314]HOE68051.1 SDR family oxidoreductase [Candidatus Omnitrophota bacterium]HQB94187.1 SDR family oxidoreductase [Candidatus Omnitrophota bacterium]